MINYIAPGDLVQWTYVSSIMCHRNDDVVHSDEEIWSSTMANWIPISGINIIISVDETKFSFLNSQGIFECLNSNKSSKNGMVEITKLKRRTFK